MFELSDELNIVSDIFLGRELFYIDNFYKNPEKVVEYILNCPAPLHKENELPSWNGFYFEDRRIKIENNSSDLTNVYKFLESVCGQTSHEYGYLVANKCKFKKNKFNDYKNNYWYPHIDAGYQAIVYLNQDDNHCGTNLYEAHCDKDLTLYPEHFAPWRKKENYKLLASIKPRYNRMVLYDGFILHGMDICNDRYFSREYRINQVFQFNE